MTGNSPSTDRPDPGPQLCGWCNAPLASPSLSCLSHPVYWQESQAAHSAASRAGAALGTLFPPLLGVGSSLTRRGGRVSRSWSVTGLSGSVSRRLRQERSAGIWERVISQRGTGTGRTSGSSRLYRGAVASTGTAARTPAELSEVLRADFEALVRGTPRWESSERWAGETPVADCDKGYKGNHLWGYVTSDEGNLFCLNCGRRK